MSVAIMGRVFWTEYPDVDYVNKNGKRVTVAPSSAKILMLAIGDSADDFGENSWNSFDTLKTKAGFKDRRSVIRVARALVDSGYISVAGLSAYGTNNFKINMSKLGELPTKRAVNGRPRQSELIKTGDSGAKTGDSGAKTGDSESPDPSFNRPLAVKQIDPVAQKLSELHFPLNPNAGVIIQGWKNDFPGRDDIIIRAITEHASKRNLTYIDRVLIDWKANGVPPTREERIAAAKLGKQKQSLSQAQDELRQWVAKNA